MCVDALSWAFRLDLPPTEKLVLLALADRADGEGTAFPSVRDTIERTGLSDRTVRCVTAKLIARGLIQSRCRFDDKNHRQRSNEYVLEVGEPGDTTLRPPRRSRRGEDDGGVRETLHQEQGNGCGTDIPLTVTKNRHKEPSQLTDSLTLTSERSKSSLLDFAAFWEAYPRKVGKLAAQKAYIRAARQSSAIAIIDGVTAYSFPTDPQFIPHASTWLNEGRWMDELPAPPVPASRGLFLDVPPGFDSSDAFGANAWGHTLTDTENHQKDGVPVLALRGYPIIEFAREVCEAAGWDQDTRCDLEPIAQAVRAGYDPDMMVDVVKTVRRPDRPTLRYYEAIWRDRHAKRSVQ